VGTGVELHGKPCGCGNRGCLETVATDMALAAAAAVLNLPIREAPVVRPATAAA